MAHLVVIEGRDPGRRFDVGPWCDLGRELQNNIRLRDSETSRRHARIMHDGDRWWIVDLGSSNGTKVNGQKIDRQALQNGDRVEIGNSVLRFECPDLGDQSPHPGIAIVGDESMQASRIVSSLPREGSGRERPAIDSRESLDVMYRTALAIGRTADLDQVLHRVLRLVFDWVGADRGCVMLKDGPDSPWHAAARCDRDDLTTTPDLSSDDTHVPGESKIEVSRTILDLVFRKREAVRTADATEDKRFDDAASVIQAGIREAICVPLEGRHGLVGVMYVDTSSSPGQWLGRNMQSQFTDEHLRLMVAIGHQAAIAIEDTRFYQALLQTERLAAVGETVAHLAHHVKNILQGIRGGSYLIETGLDRNDTEAVRRGWAMVDRNQDRINHLVLDMLTYSKPRQPQRTPQPLGDVIEDAVALMASRAKELGITLERRFASHLPLADIDGEAIHRAVLNLVGNAIEALEQHQTSGEANATPRVVIETFASEGSVGFRVSDNGPGVAAENREKIFSPFESDKGIRGTGLGLPVVAKIAGEHGGTVRIIDVADDDPGGTGVGFEMWLPGVAESPQDDTDEPLDTRLDLPPSETD